MDAQIAAYLSSMREALDWLERDVKAGQWEDASQHGIRLINDADELHREIMDVWEDQGDPLVCLDSDDELSGDSRERAASMAGQL